MFSMIASVDIKSGVDAAMKKLGISSLAEAARRCDIPYRSFMHYYNGAREPNFAMLSKMANGLHVSLESLLTGSTYQSDDLKKVPAYNDIQIAAGPARELHAYSEHTDFVYFKTKKKNVRAIKVADRSYSMNRVALPGQYIIVDFDDNNPEDLDGKFVVACHNGDCTFKRFRKEPLRLEPYSDQAGYDTTFIREYDDFRIVGRVIGVVSDDREFD